MNKQQQKKSHGGAREGAGLKPKFGVAMVTVGCRLTPLQRETFDRLGGVTWLRRVLDEADEKISRLHLDSVNGFM